MTKYFFLFFFCFFSFLSASDPITKDLPKVSQANEKNELAQLDDIIAATQRSLDQQKSLRDLLLKYQEAQKAYLKDENNVDLLYQMIKLANKSLKTIQENHLGYAFDPEFINELNLFAKMANKRNEKTAK